MYRICLSIMKGLICSIVIITCIIEPCFAASNIINITAEEFGPKIVRMDFELWNALIDKGLRNYKPNVSCIVKYQIVYIKIENNSKSILNVNQNNFTLV